MNGNFADWNPLEDNNNSSNTIDVSNIVLPVPDEAGNSLIRPEVNYPTPTPAVEEVPIKEEENKNILPGTPGIELLSTSSLLNTGNTQGEAVVNTNQGVDPNNQTIPVSTNLINPNTPGVAVTPTPEVEDPNINPFKSAPATEVELLDETQTLTPIVDTSKEEASAPLIDPTLPNTNSIQMSNMNPDIRYNPVTGEEMNVNDIINDTKKNDVVDVSQDKELKRVEIGKKIKSTWNSLLLIGLFLFLIIFVVFLPEVQTTVSNFFSGKQVEYVDTIPTGKLICTLETSSSNLDRNIERVFQYEKNKVISGKFITIVRGDITLDEESLDHLNEQCNKVKEKVNGLEGVSVSCNYENGRLEEKETFDYKTYSMEDVSTAYLDAGSSLVEIEYQEDVDRVMTLMRQGGFTCNKEK